jgi:hypothetical protein
MKISFILLATAVGHPGRIAENTGCPGTLAAQLSGRSCEEVIISPEIGNKKMNPKGRLASTNCGHECDDDSHHPTFHRHPPGGFTMIVRRALCLAAAAALPLTIGVGAAGAEGISAGQDRLSVDTNSNLTDGDNFLIDARVATVDDDGDATGVRSRTTSSDVQDLQDVHTDNRSVSNDQGGDATSSRAILGFDDLGNLDDVDSDIDVVSIDERRDGTDDSTNPVVGQDDAGADDQQQYQEDEQFVFGQQ